MVHGLSEVQNGSRHNWRKAPTELGTKAGCENHRFTIFSIHGYWIPTEKSLHVHRTVAFLSCS